MELEYTKELKLRPALIEVVINDFYKDKLFEPNGSNDQEKLLMKLKNNLAFETKLTNFEIKNYVISGNIIYKEDNEKWWMKEEEHILNFRICLTGAICDF